MLDLGASHRRGTVIYSGQHSVLQQCLHGTVCENMTRIKGRYKIIGKVQSRASDVDGVLCQTVVRLAPKLFPVGGGARRSLVGLKHFVFMLSLVVLIHFVFMLSLMIPCMQV